ncbi:hypothetical protein LCGC14_1495630 [marine sediment metagenome]|uniref:Uncharacterized protein n=1 Tax=marine sediment metagenome TaxID=412755 RepID=A0A0F9JRG0_9ZZZZ
MGCGECEALGTCQAEAAVKEATRIFDEALAVGGAAFVVDGGVDKARRITEFEPRAGEISLLFPMEGG